MVRADVTTPQLVQEPSAPVQAGTSYESQGSAQVETFNTYRGELGCGYSQYQAHSPHHQRSGDLPKLYYKSLDHGTNGGGFNGPACMNSSST
ncbi:hypothetical protein PR003_g12142 [Phytophthora rubi]|uniref:Uncharacterized protein n=1 Tax=Phytophthora rubi TaxID=129364 RepID=A0A6A4F9A2_9STRA|nr:hypothetical protein PR003_g12142 [Phytophthora rubi]